MIWKKTPKTAKTPKELFDFIKLYSGKKIRKSLVEYDDSIVIGLHAMDPTGYDMALFKRTFARVTKDIVVERTKRSYEKLEELKIPDISLYEIDEWNANVSLYMKIEKDLYRSTMKRLFGVYLRF